MSLARQMLTREGGATIAYHRHASTLSTQPNNRSGVIFLGGLASDMTGTKALHLDRFAEAQGLDFVRFDYQGHGASSGVFDEGGVETWRDDALAVLDRLTEGPQILIGSSMGGWIMQLVARARPDRVTGLIGIAAATDFSEELIWSNLPVLIQQRLMSEGVIRIPSAYDSRGYSLSRRHIEEGRRHLLLGNAIGIDCPVRLFHGTEDREVPWALSQRLLERLTSRDVTLTLIKGGDHRLSSAADLKRYETAILELTELAA